MTKKAKPKRIEIITGVFLMIFIPLYSLILYGIWMAHKFQELPMFPVLIAFGPSVGTAMFIAVNEATNIGANKEWNKYTTWKSVLIPVGQLAVLIGVFVLPFIILVLGIVTFLVLTN